MQRDFKKDDFARFLARSNAVRFGDFTLKSGKKSNIFFDFGQLFYGKELAALGGYFADFIVSGNLADIDVLFGPAYKGINIALAVSIALHERHGLSIPFAYNRKIIKDHAEGGKFVGFELAKARTALILDDVFTDGGTKYEVIDMLSGFKQLAIKAMLVGVDRQEVDDSGKPHLSIFTRRTGIQVFALTTKEDVLAARGKR
ncbi:MAG TPA: orotate phosphoribosyltransferase [bacterium]|nr:orotate phosphoribosyltransferase [bacterium]